MNNKYHGLSPLKITDTCHLIYKAHHARELGFTQLPLIDQEAAREDLRKLNENNDLKAWARLAKRAESIRVQVNAMDCREWPLKILPYIITRLDKTPEYDDK